MSESAVSHRLARTATKVGAATRADLLRIAAMLVRAPHVPRPALDVLTPSEQEVLELVATGLTNEEIATIRSRSVRTIANQVASLLRKSGAPSRRALLVDVKAGGARADEDARSAASKPS